MPHPLLIAPPSTPNRLAPFDKYPALRHRDDDAGIEGGFNPLDPLVKRRRRVRRQNRNGVLCDDRSAVDALVDEMHRAAGDFHAVIEGLFPGFQSRKRGKQGGMNVDDSIRESAEEFTFQDAHESGEHDEIDPRLLKSLDVGLFRVVIEFGAEFAGGDVFRRQPPFAGSRQNSGVGNIAENNRDLGEGGSGANGIGDRDHVRALAGTEDTDAEGSGAIHGRGGLRPVVTDRLDGTAFLGLLALFLFVLIFGLFVNEGITAVVAAGEIVGSSFAAEVAVDALIETKNLPATLSAYLFAMSAII